MRFLPVVFVFAAACANTSVTVPRVAPAEVDLKQFTKLAIGGVAGPGGPEVATAITDAIVATKRFEVIDRPALAKLINAPDLATAGRVSDASAANVGKTIGSAALVVGDVIDMKYEETAEQTYAMCSNQGRQYECLRYTRTATATCKVQLKVVSTESGQPLAARVMENAVVRSETKDGDQPKPFKADKAMLEECNKQSAKRFADVIAPHTVDVTVELLDDGSLPDLKRGNEHAKAGQWKEAVQAYQSAVASMDDKKPAVQAKALYDLGLALSFSGDHDAGLKQLERANGLDPQERTTKQIEQVKQFKVDDAKLAAQKPKS